MKESRILSACDVASFFLAVNDAYTITNTKLQKLCAYAQGICLAYLGKPLFTESIEMWEIGPVIPEVYQKYEKYDVLCIPQEPLNLSPFSMQERLVLAGVNDIYCTEYDDWSLYEKSQYDFPEGFELNTVLPLEGLKKAFETNIIVQKLRRANDLGPDEKNEKSSPEEFQKKLYTIFQ